MKLLPVLLLLPIGLLLWPHADAEPRTPSALPLAFERNAGQIPDRFEYLAPLPGTSSVALGRGGAEIASHSRRVSLAFVGGGAREPVAGRRLPGVVNHLVGDDPARWRTGIPTVPARPLPRCLARRRRRMARRRGRARVRLPGVPRGPTRGESPCATRRRNG